MRPTAFHSWLERSSHRPGNRGLAGQRGSAIVPTMLNTKQIRLLSLCALLPNLAHAADYLDFRGDFVWLNAAVMNRVDDEAALNPSNEVARVPAGTMLSDFKPNFKVTSKRLSVIARPIVKLRYDQVEAKGKTEDPKGYSRGEILEAFVQWTLSDAASFVYGKQNYSWGATESLTPSNRFFHETALARNAVYEVRGKNLARMNLSAGQNLSLVLMTEYEETTGEGEKPFAAGEVFTTKSMAKGEVSWNGGADFFGLVAGGHETGDAWVGQYFNWSLPVIEGYSIYADAMQQKGSDAWYPAVETVPSGFGPQDLKIFAQTETDSTKVRSIAVGGLRYDFENGASLRGEYIYNGLGYTKEQLRARREAFSPRELQRLAIANETQRLATNYDRAYNSGLELLSQRYAYASFTWPSAFKVKDFLINARTLYSLTDYSSSSYLAFEHAYGKAGTIFYSSSYNGGEDGSELRGLTFSSQVLGYRHSY